MVIVTSPRSLPKRNHMLILILVLIIITLVVSYRELLKPQTGKEDWSLPDSASNNTENMTPSAPDQKGDDKYVNARESMVKYQIQARDVKDTAVLDAMREVPRHEFVPSYLVSNAYDDRPLPIGHGQTICQPYIVAVMTEALHLEPGKSKALEIGTGSGYQASILAKICREVYSIEIVAPLAERASSTLNRLGFDNVYVKNADGYFGWEEHAPYDAIIVTCAASHIPPYLVEQLADGGRLILPLGSPYAWQTLTIVEKHGKETTIRYMFGVIFVPMTGEIEKGEVTEPT